MKQFVDIMKLIMIMNFFLIYIYIYIYILCLITNQDIILSDSQHVLAKTNPYAYQVVLNFKI